MASKDIKTIEIQVSNDLSSWTTISTNTYTARTYKQTYTYTIDLSSYAEGSIFVRAIATDFSGNISDTSEAAPYTEYIVDKTAPEAPTSISANGNDGYITVSWTMGNEGDLGKYFVYKSTSLDGNYHGTASRYITALEGIQDYTGDDMRVLYSMGAHLSKDRDEALSQKYDRISEALAVAEHISGSHENFAELMNAEANSTRVSVTDYQKPNVTITIPKINEYYLGQVIYFFEKACGISGYLLEVNPFNQPGVEAYKKNMFALLNKPGYEEESKAIQARL